MLMWTYKETTWSSWMCFRAWRRSVRTVCVVDMVNTIRPDGSCKGPSASSRWSSYSNCTSMYNHDLFGGLPVMDVSSATLKCSSRLGVQPSHKSGKNVGELMARHVADWITWALARGLLKRWRSGWCVGTERSEYRPDAVQVRYAWHPYDLQKWGQW